MAGGGFNMAGSKEEDTARRRAKECHECSFCKRGFTNAQALGGHMNIHRKERSGGGTSSTRDGGAAPPAPGAQHKDAGGDQVQLGPTLGRSEEVDLELRLWH